MKIRPGKESDIERIVQISDLQLGYLYLAEKDIRHYLDTDSCSILVGINNDIVCGFSIFMTSDFSGILDEIGHQHYDFLKAFSSYTKIRLKKTTVVDPEHAGSGIGSALTKRAETYDNESIDLMLTLNWKRRNGLPMNSISEKLNYLVFGEINNYWKEKSLTRRFICPECNTPPCTCTAVILYRKEQH